eukprot:scaffold10109_cov51-Attheya_sp.AAC.1
MGFLPLVEAAAAYLRVVEEEEEVECHLNLLTPDGTAFEEEAVRGLLWRAWSRRLIMDLPEEMGVFVVERRRRRWPRRKRGLVLGGRMRGKSRRRRNG